MIIDPAQQKLVHLQSILKDLGSLVVAFSGGVDSTFLLRVVAQTPGLRYLALTSDSPTNTSEELEEARHLAREFGSEHVVIAVNELETPGYADNPAHRCYLCKHTLYPLCLDLARRHGLQHVVDGVNTDDLGDYRPGLRAAHELGIRHPLVDANMSKGDVRTLSRLLGLRTAEKPASPCLSSRFPYGTEITRDRLLQVERAEAALKALGFVELRVRHLGDGARVEISAAESHRLRNDGLRVEIVRRVLNAGFASAEISPKPLRSGSLNDVLLASGDRGVG